MLTVIYIQTPKHKKIFSEHLNWLNANTKCHLPNNISTRVPNILINKP